MDNQTNYTYLTNPKTLNKKEEGKKQRKNFSTFDKQSAYNSSTQATMEHPGLRSNSQHSGHQMAVKFQDQYIQRGPPQTSYKKKRINKSKQLMKDIIQSNCYIDQENDKY